MLSEDNVLGPTSGHAVVPPQQAAPGVAGPVSGDRSEPQAPKFIALL